MYNFFSIILLCLAKSEDVDPAEQVIGGTELEGGEDDELTGQHFLGGYLSRRNQRFNQQQYGQYGQYGYVPQLNVHMGHGARGGQGFGVNMRNGIHGSHSAYGGDSGFGVHMGNTGMGMHMGHRNAGLGMTLGNAGMGLGMNLGNPGAGIGMSIGNSYGGYPNRSYRHGEHMQPVRSSAGSARNYNDSRFDRGHDDSRGRFETETYGSRTTSSSGRNRGHERGGQTGLMNRMNAYNSSF